VVASVEFLWNFFCGAKKNEEGAEWAEGWNFFPACCFLSCRGFFIYIIFFTFVTTTHCRGVAFGCEKMK